MVKVERFREYSTRILEHMEAGDFDNEVLVRDLLNWMSEADVEELYKHYGWDEMFGEVDEEEEG